MTLVYLLGVYTLVAIQGVMKVINSFVLDFRVTILDRIYEVRPIQRFWVLEVIA